MESIVGYIILFLYTKLLASGGTTVNAISVEGANVISSSEAFTHRQIMIYLIYLQ